MAGDQYIRLEFCLSMNTRTYFLTSTGYADRSLMLPASEEEVGIVR